jgi:hypothetical protein
MRKESLHVNIFWDRRLQRCASFWAETERGDFFNILSSLGLGTEVGART